MGGTDKRTRNVGIYMHKHIQVIHNMNQYYMNSACIMITTVKGRDTIIWYNDW